MADLTAEFVDKILSLSDIEELEYHDLAYTSKPIHIVNPPKIASITVTTLSALSDLYESNFEDINDSKTVFHVTSEVSVDAFSNTSNKYAQRKTYVQAAYKANGAFQFGQWLDQENFIIGLQTFIKDEGDRQYLLDLTSKISTNENLEILDNGTSQEVTAKAGTTLSKNVTLKPRVTLAPFRTFREIAQPQSEFVFRVRKGARGLPELALFEADGGAWKITTMSSIAAYLTNAIANDAATVIY